MTPESPVDKTPYCPVCGNSYASYPRGSGSFKCYACEHTFDIDDVERDDQ